MSFTQAQFKETAKSIGAIGVALVASAFMASAAHATTPAKFVQVADLNLNKPIPSNICVKDDAQGKAFDKIEAIKKTRGQTDIIEADSVHKKTTTGSPYAGITFTSNLKASETKGFLGEGYMIISNAPKGQKGTSYCFNISNDTTGIVSAINGKRVPSAVNIGELGAGLTNAMDISDSKVGYIAVTSKQTLLAVTFNYKTKKGGYILADGAGNNSLPIALVNVEYSMNLPPAYQKALGLPLDNMASTGGIVAVAPQ